MAETPSDLPRFSRRVLMAVVICGLAGFVVFHFFGNATRGYIATASVFIWWLRQWFDPTAETEHGPLILGVAIWLFFRNIRREAGASEAAMRSAVLALLGGLALHLMGYAAQQTRLSLAGLILFTWGLLTLAGGRRWQQAALFPCAFLLLAIPVNFLDTLGYHLRLYVVESVNWLARLFHVAVIRNGTQLFAPDGHYQYDVAAACSGVRSLVALLALALLVGYLEFRTWWVRALLVLANLPIIFLANVARVCAIVFAGEWAGRETGEEVHAWSGYLVFVVVIALLLAMTRVFQKLMPFSVGEERPMDFGGTDAGYFVGSTAVLRTTLTVSGLTVLAAVVVAWCTVKLDHRPLRLVVGVRLAEDGLNPVALPTFLGTEWIGQRVEVTAAEKEVLPPDTGYSRKNYISTEDRMRQVFFSIVLSGRDRTSIHRPELCLGGQGWTIQSRARRVLTGRGALSIPVTVLRIQREVLTVDGQRHVVPSLLVYWFVGGQQLIGSHVGMLWQNAVDGLLHFRADRWAYVVMQTSDFDGDEAAIKRMEKVLSVAWPEVVAPAQTE